MPRSNDNREPQSEWFEQYKFDLMGVLILIEQYVSGCTVMDGLVHAIQ